MTFNRGDYKSVRVLAHGTSICRRILRRVREHTHRIAYTTNLPSHLRLSPLEIAGPTMLEQFYERIYRP